MKSRILSVDELRLDGDTQARVKIHEETVEDYTEKIQDADGDWPLGELDVFHDGSDYFVADGFHRTLAALRASRGSVPCRIHKGTAIDAKIYGMTANDRHGLRMSRADKRGCVEWLLDKGGKLTQDEIAKKAGVSRRTVQLVVADRKPEKAQIALSDASKPKVKPPASERSPAEKDDLLDADMLAEQEAIIDSQSRTDEPEQPQASVPAKPPTEEELRAKDVEAWWLDLLRELNKAVEQVTEAKKRKATALRKIANLLDPPTKFVPPTLDEVTVYCSERSNHVDPEAFVAHYSANGWRVGKGSGKPMSDWRSAVVTWEKMNGAKANGRPLTKAEIREQANAEAFAALHFEDDD